MLAQPEPAFWLLLFFTVVLAVVAAWIITRTLAVAWPSMWRAGLAFALLIAAWVVIGLLVQVGPSLAGILWAESPHGLLTFILLTLVLGGLGAWAAGRALAQTWRPMPMIALYMLFLTAGVRFLHYALYGEMLLSLHFFIVAYVWTIGVAAFGYRQMRAAQMATQYSWEYQRVGLSWRAKTGGESP